MLLVLVIFAVVAAPTQIDSLRVADDIPCPQYIMDAAEAYLEKRLGTDGLARGASFEGWRHVSGKPGCVSWDPIADEDRYVLIWEVAVEGKEVTSLTVALNISEDARRIETGPWGRLPDCVNEPTKCQFPIGKTEAKEIARAALLEKGERRWSIGFHWDPEVQTYVWTVTNTLEEYERGSRGRSVIIDANNGYVLYMRRVEEIRL